MDGVTKQLADYFGKLEKLGDMAVEAIKEQVDVETDAVEAALRSDTPVDTGKLAASLTKADVSTSKKYGYRLSYDGTDEYGTPLEKVANILNFGSSTVKPRKFVTKAIRKLKGLDDRAAKRFEEISTNYIKY
ncbi:MAG: hypothetical protein LBF68_04340 [Christensenellaceae bacterium]|jgi:HK97 gp10 family phage protein|nr:hypothetical protein [Christensenellaceae bacterium]